MGAAAARVAWLPSSVIPTPRARLVVAAAKDVIAVTFNYRLGVFGFLGMSDAHRA